MTCMLLVKGLPLSCQIQMYSCHKASCSQLIGTSFFLSCVHFNEKMLLFPLPNPNLVYLCPAKPGEISWPEKAHSSLCSSLVNSSVLFSAHIVQVKVKQTSVVLFSGRRGEA